MFIVLHPDLFLTFLRELRARHALFKCRSSARSRDHSYPSLFLL